MFDSLEERIRRDQIRHAADRLAYLVSPCNPDRLIANHERPRPCIDIDKEPIGPVFGIQQRAHRSPKPLVVAGHHKHRNGFPIVSGRSNDHVTQKTSTDFGSNELIAKSKRDPVASMAMNRAFLDRNNAAALPLVMPHDESASSWSGPKDKCNLLPEVRRHLALLSYRNK